MRELTYSEHEIVKIAHNLDEKYPAAEILINQIVMLETGVLIIFTVDVHATSLPPVQRVAMYSETMECKWDHMC